MVSALVDPACGHNPNRRQLGAAQNLVGDLSGSDSSIYLDGLLFINLAPADAAKRRFAADGAANPRACGKIRLRVNQGRIEKIGNVAAENQALQSAIIDIEAI